jgi:membrane protein
MGFAAMAILTIIPLLIAAANPAPERGLAGWVVDGMGLTGSSSAAMTLLFSAPARVLGTTGVFSALLVAVSGVAFAGGVQAGFERIWGLPVGPWHKIWRQLVWLTVLTAYIYVEATVGTVTQGGLAVTAAVAVILGILFFWWGLRFLLGGRLSSCSHKPQKRRQIPDPPPRRFRLGFPASANSARRSRGVTGVVELSVRCIDLVATPQ